MGNSLLKLVNKLHLLQIEMRQSMVNCIYNNYILEASVIFIGWALNWDLMRFSDGIFGEILTSRIILWLLFSFLFPAIAVAKTRTVVLAYLLLLLLLLQLLLLLCRIKIYWFDLWNVLFPFPDQLTGIFLSSHARVLFCFEYLCKDWFAIWNVFPPLFESIGFFPK